MNDCDRARPYALIHPAERIREPDPRLDHPPHRRHQRGADDRDVRCAGAVDHSGAAGARRAKPGHQHPDAVARCRARRDRARDHQSAGRGARRRRRPGGNDLQLPRLGWRDHAGVQCRHRHGQGAAAGRQPAGSGAQLPGRSAQADAANRRRPGQPDHLDVTAAYGRQQPPDAHLWRLRQRCGQGAHRARTGRGFRQCVRRHGTRTADHH